MAAWLASAIRSVLGQILAPFAPLAKEGTSVVAQWIIKGSPPLLRFLALMFLIASVGLGWYLWKRTSGVSEILLGSLRARQEQTAQPYKGLEAFVLAGINSNMEASLQDARVSKTFADSLRQMVVRFSTAAANKVSVEMVTLGQSAAKTYITDNRPGFLFVPGLSFKDTKALMSRKPGSIAVTSDTEPDLTQDISASQQIAQDLCGLGDHEVFSQAPSNLQSKPKQAYFVTRMGVARLCELDAEETDQHAYYKDQFPATTMFQDRPYFEPTRARSITTADDPGSADELATSFFYDTRPYIDLGGNGFVKTFCRAINLPPSTEAIVCLDFSFNWTAQEGITRQLDLFGSTWARVSCTPQNCSLTDKPSILDQMFPSLGVIERDMEPLNQSLAELTRRGSSNLAEMFGKIRVYPDERLTGRRVVNQSDSIVMTVPVGQGVSRSVDNTLATRKADLLYARINLARFQTNTSILAGATGASILMFLFMIALMVADYGLRVREQDRAFQSVDRVMEKSPVAYCRSGQNGGLVDYNEAFVIGLLGFKDMEEAHSFFRKNTFLDLLADKASIETYTAIQALRKQRKLTDPYNVNLWRAGANIEKVAVEIHGSAVPGPINPKDKEPQSFGIILRSSSRLQVVPATPILGTGTGPD